MHHFLIISQQNPFFARLVLAMALSNKAVLVNLFVNDSLELIMVISDVGLQAANEWFKTFFFCFFVSEKMKKN